MLPGYAAAPQALLLAPLKDTTPQQAAASGRDLHARHSPWHTPGYSLSAALCSRVNSRTASSTPIYPAFHHYREHYW